MKAIGVTQLLKLVSRALMICVPTFVIAGNIHHLAFGSRQKFFKRWNRTALAHANLKKLKKGSVLSLLKGPSQRW